jgi:lipoyl(octanoyl) transferase
VELIERAIIETLDRLEIPGKTRAKAPGVYVDDAKIAALGLRIKNGCSYHGLSFNIDMDLSPFASINPCGFAGLNVTQVADFVTQKEQLMQRVSNILIEQLLYHLGYEKQSH